MMPIRPMLFAKAAVAANALIQKSAKFVRNNQSTFTETNAFAASVTVGNTVFVMVAHYRGGSVQTTSVTAGGVSLSLDKRLVVSGSYDLEIWRGVATSTSRNVTLTWSGGSAHGVTFGAMEFTPLAASPKDKENTGTSTGTSAISATNATANAQAQSLVLAFATVNASGLMGMSSPASSSYTSLFIEQDGSANSSAEASYKLVSSIETSSATWTRTLSGTANAMIVSYKFP